MGSVIAIIKVIIDQEIEDLCAKKFFEESSKSGSISEKIGNMLAETTYCGRYSSVTADNFVKQASVKSCLEKLGMSSNKMTEYIRRRKAENAET